MQLPPWFQEDWFAQRAFDQAQWHALSNAKPPRHDLTQRQIDWCRKHIPAFNMRDR